MAGFNDNQIIHWFKSLKQPTPAEGKQITITFKLLTLFACRIKLLLIAPTVSSEISWIFY